jgi:hypothetical protein
MSRDPLLPRNLRHERESTSRSQSPGTSAGSSWGMQRVRIIQHSGRRRIRNHSSHVGLDGRSPWRRALTSDARTASGPAQSRGCKNSPRGSFPEGCSPPLIGGMMWQCQASASWRWDTDDGRTSPLSLPALQQMSLGLRGSSRQALGRPRCLRLARPVRYAT